jgi:hypothetical protein
MKRKTVDGVVKFGVMNYRTKAWAVEPTYTNPTDADRKASIMNAWGV